MTSCSSCGHECSTGPTLLTEGAGDSEVSMRDPLVIIGFIVLFTWDVVLSLVWFHSLTVL